MSSNDEHVFTHVSNIDLDFFRRVYSILKSTRNVSRDSNYNLELIFDFQSVTHSHAFLLTFKDGTTSRNKTLFAIGLKNEEKFICLGFCEADSGKNAENTYRYYQQILDNSGHKKAIYEKTVALISDSDATQLCVNKAIQADIYKLTGKHVTYNPVRSTLKCVY